MEYNKHSRLKFSLLHFTLPYSPSFSLFFF